MFKKITSFIIGFLSIALASSAAQAAALTPSQITAEIQTLLADNANGNIRAIWMRQLLQDLYDSSAVLGNTQTWTAPQTFSVAPIFSSQTGYCYANGASPVTCATTLPIAAVPNAAPQVANNTALSALASTYSGAIVRLGFAAVGDAPPVTYTPSGSACSLNAGAGDGGSQIPTSDGKCWIGKLPAPAPVEIWGAKGDGATNDSAAFAAADAYGAFQLQAKTYAISSPITFTHEVIGQGLEESIIKVTASMDAVVSVNTTDGRLVRGVYVDCNYLGKRGFINTGDNAAVFITIRAEHCLDQGLDGALTGVQDSLLIENSYFRSNGKVWYSNGVTLPFLYGATQTSLGATTVTSATSTLTFTGLDPTTLSLVLNEDVVVVAGQVPVIVTGVTSTTITTYPALGTVGASAYSIYHGNGIRAQHGPDNNRWTLAGNNVSSNANFGIYDAALYGAMTSNNIFQTNGVVGITSGQRVGGGVSYSGESNGDYFENNGQAKYWVQNGQNYAILNPFGLVVANDLIIDAASSVHYTAEIDGYDTIEYINSTSVTITKNVSSFVQSGGANNFTVVLPTAPKHTAIPEAYVMNFGAMGGKSYTITTASAGTLVNGVAGTTGIPYSGSNRQLVARWSANANGWIIGSDSVQETYSIVAPATGSTVTLLNGNIDLIVNPAGTLANLTLAFPATPTNNQTAAVVFEQVITALATSGGTVVGAPASASVGQGMKFIYNSGTTTWYRVQ